ncbi:hypothetical protein RDWZM_005676 [Blomia tropicalis]|uniref:Uncharacterized protein n=1 Tax=Blomia tropicalis TaxID=40697 RepID=A0A9Q0RMK2_BLOTA|nr:hypothetical protein RDWZM_005676 [Blomia tropicalis]
MDNDKSLKKILKELNNRFSKDKKFMKGEVKKLNDEITKVPLKNIMERLAEFKKIEVNIGTYMTELNKFKTENSIIDDSGLFDKEFYERIQNIQGYLKLMKALSDDDVIDYFYLVAAVKPTSNLLNQNTFSNKIKSLREKVKKDDKVNFLSYMKILMIKLNGFINDNPGKKLSITTTNCSTLKAYLKKLIIEYYQYEPRLTEPIDGLKKILHQYEECESLFNLIQPKRELIDPVAIQKRNNLRDGVSKYEICEIHNQQFTSFRSYSTHIEKFHSEYFTIDDGEPFMQQVQDETVFQLTQDIESVSMDIDDNLPTLEQLDTNESVSIENNSNVDLDTFSIGNSMSQDDDEDEDESEFEDYFNDSNEIIDNSLSNFFNSLKRELTLLEQKHFDEFAKNYMLERINSNVSVEAGQNILNTVLNSPSLTMNTVYVDKMKQFIRSKFLQNSYVESLDSYIPAREIVVPSFDQNKNKKYYYIPIEKTLKTLLTDELISIILNESASSLSEYVLENNLNNKLRIGLYGDDFTITNPIGASSKKQKIFGLYLDINNWPVYKYHASEIPALIFAHRETIEELESINHILKILVSDIKKLTKHGIQVLFNGEQVKIEVGFAFIMGDNLAVNEMLGLSRTFGKYFICRYCQATYSDIKEDLSSNKELNFRKNINYIEESQKAIRFKSPLGIMVETEIAKICKNIFQVAPPDTMHDLSEGIVPELCLLILKEFKINKLILKNKLAQIQWVNGAITIEKDGNIRGKATQKLEFVIRMVELFPEWLFSKNDAFILYECIRVIIAVAMSSSPLLHIGDMQKVLPEFSRLMQKFRLSTPKAHMVTHYDQLLQYYGNFASFNTARMERKNGQNKKFLRHSKNYKNSTFSMAKCHQYYMALRPLIVDVQNEEGDTPLHRAAYTGRDRIVVLLISHNANVFLPNGDGLRPFELAKTETIRQILSAAEKPDIKRRETRFLSAVRNSNIATMKKLLEDSINPVNINCVDSSGNTALHYPGKQEAVVFLLKNQIDTTVKNNRKQLAREHHELERSIITNSTQTIHDANNHINGPSSIEVSVKLTNTDLEEFYDAFDDEDDLALTDTDVIDVSNVVVGGGGGVPTYDKISSSRDSSQFTNDVFVDGILPASMKSPMNENNNKTQFHTAQSDVTINDSISTLSPDTDSDLTLESFEMDGHIRC